MNPFKAEKKPYEMIIIGFLYASIGLFLSLLVFAEHSSLVMIFLTAMACIPLMYETIKYEESKYLEFPKEKRLLFEHSKALLFLLCLFLGAAIAYAVWYIFLPASLSITVFNTQSATIASLNQKVMGHAIHFGVLGKIFLNNVKVLIFCIIFSFIFGSGAIFILMWNASVIGVALGNFFRLRIAEYSNALGLEQVSSYFFIISLSVLRYAIHGIPEIFGYIVAGLAGGMISVAIIRHDLGTKDFERVILDVSNMILLSLFIIFIAALLEVYVTPVFF